MCDVRQCVKETPTHGKKAKNTMINLANTLYNKSALLTTFSGPLFQHLLLGKWSLNGAQCLAFFDGTAVTPYQPVA